MSQTHHSKFAIGDRVKHKILGAEALIVAFTIYKTGRMTYACIFGANNGDDKECWDLELDPVHETFGSKIKPEFDFDAQVYHKLAGDSDEARRGGIVLGVNVSPAGLQYRVAWSNYEDASLHYASLLTTEKPPQSFADVEP